MNSFIGVYPTYEAAAAEAFGDRELGWNTNAVVAAELDQPSVYASLYWISKLLGPGQTIVDFGGATGKAYRDFIARQPLPEGANGVVVDLPKVVERGLAHYAGRPPTSLKFSSDLSLDGPCDIFFSAGCIQYLDATADDIARLVPASAQHVLFNKFALTDKPSFFTLQHLGDSMSPNQIFNEKQFVAAFERAGFDLTDRWAVPELNCQIPFEPDCFVPQFAGVLFSRRARQ
ncbi:MAG TPA: methyltransferase, TIGR04325 family [Hyphomicrobiaceae bacterium]|nr:methyltransferase, TIGR04325 family [Hyphomicrobiaceae bacterium]